MAGTTTLTEIGPLYEPRTAGVQKVTGQKFVVDWTSDASGDVNGETLHIRGFVVKVITNPGSTAPTDNYDFELTDPDDSSLDLLAGACLNRDTATTEQVYPVVSGAATPPYANGYYGFKISNAGNAKQGRVILYVLTD